MPRCPEPEESASDDDHVRRRIAVERPSRSHLAGFLEPPAVTRVEHQAGAAAGRRASAMLHAITAATAIGTSSVQTSEMPPKAAPTDTRTRKAVLPG